MKLEYRQSAIAKVIILLAALCALSGHGAWKDAVSHQDGNWQWLNNVWLHAAGGNWHWVAGADVWIWVHAPEQEPPPAGFVLIPAGTFTMGSPVDEPGHFPHEVQHMVTLTRAFYLQATEGPSSCAKRLG